MILIGAPQGSEEAFNIFKSLKRLAVTTKKNYGYENSDVLSNSSHVALL
jgi:hypothetical protein